MKGMSDVGRVKFVDRVNKSENRVKGWRETRRDVK